MVIGIDASNIRQGGGVTHLLEILVNFNKDAHKNISKIIVWAPDPTLQKLPEFPWLIKDTQSLLNGNIISRSYWQFFKLKQLVKLNNLDVLFSLCNNVIKNVNTVLICHSHLPLERKEINRYPWSMSRIRLEILRIKFVNSYKRAKGIVFLTQASMSLVNGLTDITDKKWRIIPHGFNGSLFKPKSTVNDTGVIKIAYVSPLEPYKHQYEVLQSIKLLIEEGYKIEISMIGSQMPLETSKVNSLLLSDPLLKKSVHIVGNVSYEKLNEYYENADIFVYASTCESFGIILLEAMACKLPIACSDISSLKETLKDAGTYFNAEDPVSIKTAIKLYLDNDNLKIEHGLKALHYSKNYSWKSCSDNTFEFLETIS